MYRRLSNSLPPDPEYPADLEKLGYAIYYILTPPILTSLLFITSRMNAS